jgi:hypothetical protein
MKFKILTRLAETGSYYKLQLIDFDKLSKILPFPNEVFAYIDDIRVAFPREEYDAAKREYIKHKNVTGNPI